MFETLLSNKNMKEQLGASLKNGTVLHAYLFCGADGTGKLTAATAFAAEIIGDRDRVLRGAHPDVIYIRHEEGKSTISVDAIRDMRADAFITPTEASHKIYIIDGAHELNDSGQNALLTILEQPPSFCIFILLTENKDQILPTVISRCISFDMEYVDEDEGAKYLQSQFKKTPIETLKIYMKASQGNVGLAKKMATGTKFAKQVEKCEKIAIAIANGDKYTIAKEFMPIRSKDTLLALLPVLSVYLRDIMVLNSTQNEGGIVFYDSILKNRSIFDKIDIGKAYHCISECQKSISELESSINVSLVTSSLTINLYGGKNS